jgi:hypothetical protein
MIITGNKDKGLAAELFKIYPDATFCSRENGYDLVTKEGRERFANNAVEHDVIILNSALWQFQQTVLLDTVYRALITAEKTAYIVCIGSTTDRVNKGTSWLYNAEKKALRDYCNSLSLLGVWNGGPRVSYISFGTLSNNQHKHPDRTCMDISIAATYIKWIIDQPVHINEISVDPIQLLSE